MKITKLFQFSQPLSTKKMPPKEPIFLGLTKKDEPKLDLFIKDKEKTDPCK